MNRLLLILALGLLLSAGCEPLPNVNEGAKTPPEKSAPAPKKGSAKPAPKQGSAKPAPEDDRIVPPPNKPGYAPVP